MINEVSTDKDMVLPFLFAFGDGQGTKQNHERGIKCVASLGVVNMQIHRSSSLFRSAAKLRVLQVAGNALVELPNFGQVPALEILDVHSNRISQLPQNLMDNCKRSEYSYRLIMLL